jgi:hypothetical protein
VATERDGVQVFMLLMRARSLSVVKDGGVHQALTFIYRYTGARRLHSHPGWRLSRLCVIVGRNGSYVRDLHAWIM